MTNETLETIKKRRSCRAYKPEQITDEELNAVLEAGTYAASAMGRQSAKIVVVQDAAARAQLTRMNAVSWAGTPTLCTALPPFWWCWPMLTPQMPYPTAALSWAT